MADTVINGRICYLLRQFASTIERAAREKNIMHFAADAVDLCQNIKEQTLGMEFNMWDKYDDNYILILKLHHILSAKYDSFELYTIYDYIDHFENFDCGNFFDSSKSRFDAVNFLAKVFMKSFLEIAINEGV